VRLSDDDREWLSRETAAVLDQLPPTAARNPYQELLTAVDQGEVPDDLLEPLSRLLAVGLESGRIRKLYSAHAEMAAVRLYARTPAGKAAAEAVARVNEALADLAGATLHRIACEARAPGSQTLVLETDRGVITLLFDRQGVRVHSAEVAG